MVCRTFDHFIAGMKQLYEVNSCTNMGHSRQLYATMRTFYIAAEEVEWDYASNKSWALRKQNMTGEAERYLSTINIKPLYDCYIFEWENLAAFQVSQNLSNALWKV